MKLIAKLSGITLAAVLAMPLSMGAQDLKLSADNIDQILNAMTLEEKATLLVGGGNRGFSSSTESTIGATQNLVPGAAGTTAGIPRLGIPPTVLADGPAGIRISPTRKGDAHTYYATGFPVGVALASSWNTELVEEVGKAIGNEVLEYGADVLLAPGMNLHRNPLCGRTFEYYSEDPVVTGKIAAAYVNGVQSNGVGTSVKHYAANSQETNRTGVDEIVTPRALRELYLKGFEIAVKEAKPWTVMSSYNKLNGPFTQENKELLTTVLRDEWGFDGIVMTDWIGKRNTARQVQAGNDLMEPGNVSQVEEIIEMVNNNELAMEDVDKCVRRILQYIVKTPRFKGYKYSNTPDLKLHADITRKSATEGMVLLKNENNTLPLADVDSVALFGITSYDFIAGGTGSGDVNKPYVIDLLTGLKNVGLDVNSSLADLYLSYKDYNEKKAAHDRAPGGWFWGKQVLEEMPLSRNAIDKQADLTDVAIITLGRQAGEGRDRVIDNDFNLTETERTLLTNVCDAFHAKDKRVVVILNMGAPIETASWKNLPDAILMAWQPGQEGGNSVADVLVGNQNPSGKLTMTFPISAMDHPSSLNFPVDPSKRGSSGSYNRQPAKNVDYTRHDEGIKVGYRYFDTENKNVSYPFGYGLSYTDFAYSKPMVKADKDGFTAYVTVTNTGKVGGKEIVEVYVEAPKGSLEKPRNELKSFAKTKYLKPGESQTLSFKVTDYDLASFDEAGSRWVADAGNYKVKFATSLDKVLATADYTMRKTFILPVNDVLRLADSN